MKNAEQADRLAKVWARRVKELNPGARDPYHFATLELIKPNKLDLDYEKGHVMTVEREWFEQRKKAKRSETPESREPFRLSRVHHQSHFAQAVPREAKPRALEIERMGRRRGDLPSAERLAAKPAKEARSLISQAFAHFRERRSHRLAEVRRQAKEGLRLAKARNKDRKAKILAALANNLRAELLRIAETKAAEIKLAKDAYHRDVERARAIAEAMKRHKAAVAAAKRKHAGDAVRVKAAARMREKKGEAHEEARRNVEAEHPELLPYFDKVKSKLKHTKQRSRTEHFYQLAHDDPEGAILASQRAADKAVHAMLKHQPRTWESRAKSIESRICSRAGKLFMKGRPFALSSGERSALKKLGIDHEQIETACYRPPRRIVSGRGQTARASAPF